MLRASLVPALTIALAATALTACSQADRRTPEPVESGTATPAPAPATSPPPQVAVVPARFQGIWDAETGSCDPTSDMRTEIAERGITFYESHGAVSKVTVTAPDTIMVELAMTGEGDKWTLRRNFTLSNGDRTLTPSAVDAETFTPLPLKRCA